MFTTGCCSRRRGTSCWGSWRRQHASPPTFTPSWKGEAHTHYLSPFFHCSSVSLLHFFSSPACPPVLWRCRPAAAVAPWLPVGVPWRRAEALSAPSVSVISMVSPSMNATRGQASPSSPTCATCCPQRQYPETVPCSPLTPWLRTKPSAPMTPRNP